MKKNQELMKHFASVLRKMSQETDLSKPQKIDESMSYFLTRKELILIVTEKFKSNVPKHINLIELENAELVNLIGDVMFIIAYMTKKWCEDRVGLDEENHEN